MCEYIVQTCNFVNYFLELYYNILMLSLLKRLKQFSNTILHAQIQYNRFYSIFEKNINTF